MWKMRTLCITLSFFMGSLVSCNRADSSRRDEPGPRQAGREAYRASQELKRGAKEAAHDLRTAGKQFREGWTEEKHEDRTVRRK